ncbi:MAG TPA: hypothetical protein VLA16_19410 [Ideonella sp.]|nr:hypothetical protein [Ideonella sp.]
MISISVAAELSGKGAGPLFAREALSHAGCSALTAASPALEMHGLDVKSFSLLQATFSGIYIGRSNHVLS